MSAVKLVDLSVVRNRVAILREINLDIDAGDAVGFLGPNGAGKSTLLKCLAGLVRVDSGEIEWFDASQHCTHSIRRQIGYAGHEHGLYLELTALENLVFATRMFGLQSACDVAAHALNSAGLASIANQQVARLSQGMRQRVAIVRATLNDPRLILLDEPFAGLDAKGHDWLESLFTAWRQLEKTVCFVSHDLDLSRRLADRLISLAAGSMIDIETIKRWNRRNNISLRSA